ncbi:spore germination protein [Clostridium cylindrosporum]|uniref:Spore germination protein KA n=1 Tax=Clostridium cylindrosporum DSM 605 TaxID=1121307 RepID=A0A0J8DEY7_CLOCY|nr:spore germination protein [Clostridium cylindrosporum]KMT22819.1 spore germination protein KA [Clostridium cylindrosporum DSM 605]
MNFFNFRKPKEMRYEYAPDTKTEVQKSVDETVAIFRDTFKDTNDVIFREFTTGDNQKVKGFLCQIDGISDKMLIDHFVMEPLTILSRRNDLTTEDLKVGIYEAIEKSTIAVTDIKEVDYIEEAMLSILSGETVLFLEGYDKAMIIASRSWPARGPSEPVSETVIRGPRDGFVESLRSNTALVRRRIRDPRLKVKQSQLGTRSKTDIALMYIEGLVDKGILEKVERKLKAINIDSILDSGYVQQFLEERKYTPFPQIQATERPDVSAAAIFEGRIVLMVDNSPTVLILPVTMTAFFQSAEDYYVRPFVATAVRLLRLISIIIAVLAPPLYIALASFNPEAIPAKLALSIAASREGVPFPAFIEMLIMEVTLDILREAGVRLPRPIGSTIGVVGGLVIGQAAVTAGIASPIAIIVIAVTALAQYSTPNYEIETAFKTVRIGIIFLSAVLGLYGVVLGIIALIIHLVMIDSYGVPYFEPLAPMNLKDLKDSMFIRVPWQQMKERPQYVNNDNKIRQAGGSSDQK